MIKFKRKFVANGKSTVISIPPEVLEAAKIEPKQHGIITYNDATRKIEIEAAKNNG